MRIEIEGFWPEHWGFERRVLHGLSEIITNQHIAADAQQRANAIIISKLNHIEALLLPQPVASFIITQKGDSQMPTQGPLTGLAPGATGTFTAQPVDASQNPTTLPVGAVPVWTSDDSSDVVTPAADGLSATVAVSAGATPGGTHTLSVAMPDGSANSANALPILAPAVQPVASFVVTQS